MTAMTADLFVRTPPFARAAEALSAIAAQHGRARAAAWARSSSNDDDITRICAIAMVLENVKLALALLGDLERTKRTGNSRKIARVRRRLDRVLEAIAAIA
jgi:hypothetical protein